MGCNFLVGFVVVMMVVVRVDMMMVVMRMLVALGPPRYRRASTVHAVVLGGSTLFVLHSLRLSAGLGVGPL